MVRESRKEDLKEILELYLHLHEESSQEQSDFLSQTREQIMQDITVQIKQHLFSGFHYGKIYFMTRGIKYE